MIKLWKLENWDVWVALENEYMQTHFAQNKMQEELEKLVNKFVYSFGWKVIWEWETLSIVWTRNPEGVYSDLEGWVQNEDYEVSIAKKEEE